MKCTVGFSLQRDGKPTVFSGLDIDDLDPFDETAVVEAAQKYKPDGWTIVEISYHWSLPANRAENSKLVEAS